MDKVVLIDKPQGLTSQQAVSALKRALRVRRAGHTGTLDPIATGLLLVLTGEATKASRLFMELPKEYHTRVRLGQRTDTFDADGRVIATADVSALTAQAISEVLGRFRGLIRQTPPMYSALKHQGQPLYKLARRGIEVKRPERTVEVQTLELLEFTPPYAELLIICSRGTYVRSLVDDIGMALGVYAHIAGLVRTRIGPFSLEDAATLKQLREGTASASALLELDEALGFLPELRLSPAQYERARHGAPFSTGARPFSGTVRLKDPWGKLFAIGRAEAGRARVERMFHL